MNREQLVKKIVHAALERLSIGKSFIHVDNIDKKPIGISFDQISILHSTPFTCLPGSDTGYLLDIWDSKRKVLSVRWQKSPDDLFITSFKRDEWINALLPDVES